MSMAFALGNPCVCFQWRSFLNERKQSIYWSKKKNNLTKLQANTDYLLDIERTTKCGQHFLSISQMVAILICQVIRTHN